MKTYILAEAGVNHNGSLDTAKKMIDVAVDCKVDAIKFQTFKSENLVVKTAKKAIYQIENTGSEESQFDMIKKLELSYNEFVEIKKYCYEKGIDFISTPFDFESIDFLKKLNMTFWKIPSGEITNLPYLIRIGETKKDVILSTGMCNLYEIEDAIKILKDSGTPKITLLHCNTEYPTPYSDVNLKAILTLKEKFGVDIGYSDHTLGIEVSIAAVALGATVIEKHFTLDKTMEGPDHKASLEPIELKALVLAIRNIEKSLGTGEKVPSNSEMKNIFIARKSIVAKCDIKKGEILSDENVTTKRPANGINPMKWFSVIGQKAIKDFERDELIEL